MTATTATTASVAPCPSCGRAHAVHAGHPCVACDTPIGQAAARRASGDITPAVRRSRRARWISAGVLVVVAVLFGFLVTAKRPDPHNPLPGQPAPIADRAFTSLDGQPVRLADLRGRFVVLNFFASWCVPCQQEHPELAAFAARHDAVGDASIVQVVFADREADARAFRAKKGGTWPVLLDPDGRFALEYGVRGPPETFLIDPQGNVLVNIKGAVNEAGLEGCVSAAKTGRRSCGIR